MKKIVLSVLSRTIIPLVLLDACLLVLFAAFIAALKGGPKDFSLGLLFYEPSIVFIVGIDAWLVWQQQRWFRMKHLAYCS